MKIIDGDLSCEIEIPERESGLQRIVCQMTSDSINRDMARVSDDYNDGEITEEQRNQKVGMLQDLQLLVWDALEAIIPAVVWTE